MTQYSSAGKARSEALRRKCVEFLAHYSLSATHSGCTVAYDKDTATISVCETEAATAASDNSSGYTNVSFRGTGLNVWYRKLNHAGYRTFMGGHELTWIEDPSGDGEEEIWHYLDPPLHTHGSNAGSSTNGGGEEEQETATGAITFMGHNTSCTFQIKVNYNSNSGSE